VSQAAGMVLEGLKSREGQGKAGKAGDRE
jgi:hypothetical protein